MKPRSAGHLYVRPLVQAYLYRHPGFIGRLVPLDILVNGERVGSIKGGKTEEIALPDNGAEIQVVLQNHLSSPALNVPPGSKELKLECGNPLWVFFDVLSFSYLPWLRKRAFFLREQTNAKNLPTVMA